MTAARAQPNPAGTTSTGVEVLIVGAGPVGLTLANSLGMNGVHTLVVDERDRIIDYPRGVGLDDESLRGFQGIGLVDRVLPHTTPNQIMRFVDARRRVLAEIAPSGEVFGWPRRNGFVQPMVDAELLDGLERFDCVEVRWGQHMQGFEQDGDGVSVDLSGDAGSTSVRASWVVGCDGGRSATRRLLRVPFDGTTSPTRWLVVDIRTDPLGRPNIDVGADPRRPYVSVSIAPRHPALRVHDPRQRDRRGCRGPGVRRPHDGLARPASRAPRRDPPARLHPPLPDRTSLPQRPGVPRR